MILDRLPLFTSSSDYITRFNMEMQNKLDSIFQTINEFSNMIHYKNFEDEKNDSESAIVKIYAIASKLESIYAMMTEKSKFIPVFSKKLEAFWRMKGKFPEFELNFLKNACDHVLTKYLTNPDLSESIVNISVNEYLKHCGNDRLIQLTSNIFDTRQAFVELSNFVEKNCDPLDVEARIIFDHFGINFNSDKRDMRMLEKNLMDVLTDADENMNYQILFRILNFNDETAAHATAKKCIVSIIISSQLILKQKSFCNSLFNLPCSKLCHILKQYPIILDSVFEVISISLEQYEFSCSGEDIVWICKDSDLLSYSETIGILRTLTKMSFKFEEFVRKFIHSRKSGNSFMLVEEIESAILKCS